MNRVFAVTRRHFQFASSSYASSFELAAPVATEVLRENAVRLLRAKDDWYEHPIRSIVKGVEVAVTSEHQMGVTVDAFGNENGATALSSFDEVTSLWLEATQQSVDVDEATRVSREVESLMFDPEGAVAPRLVANQARDFHKQDGVTEIEECVQTSMVERALNDRLLAAERDGVVVVDRTPAIVCAVQNFSHFLDLSRKVFRNIEVGVPVVVLARGAAGQHVFRWAKELSKAVEGTEVAKLIFFANCDLATQKRLFTEVVKDAAPVYLTGSREAAAKVKDMARRLFASTGGPNTMVLCSDGALEIGAFAAAARDSAMIENAGQCTALRHVVAPGAHKLTPLEFERRLLGPAKGGTWDSDLAVPVADALESGQFSALLTEAPSLPQTLKDQGYSMAGECPSLRDAKDRVAWKVHERSAPDARWAIDEHWRQVVLDVTSPPSRAALMDDDAVRKLADWLLASQPISLVVNKDAVDDPEALVFARRLWERTACAVFAVGDVAKPALTAQARPQDCEIFGEVPPRARLDAHTAAVVFVPSSTPSFAASYADAYLRSSSVAVPPAVAAIVEACDDPSTKGYCKELYRHLADAATGPRRLMNSVRDGLWGLQRPPLGRSTWLRLSATDPFDAAAPALVAFVATNAASQLRVSVHPANTDAINKMAKAIGGALLDDAFSRKRTDSQFTDDVNHGDPWNVVRAADYACGARGLTTHDPSAFALADHFLARLFPIGHVKSTRTDDTALTDTFATSPKWLKLIA